MLLHDILSRGEREFPASPALVFRDQITTYGSLATAVERFAASLKELGLKSGDRISLLLPNCTPFVIAYYASARLGIVVVPVNPLLKPAELEYMWRDAEVKLVVTASPLLPSTQSARQNLPQLKFIVNITPSETLDATQFETPGLLFLPEMMAEGAKILASNPLPPTSHYAKEDDCAVIIYTSGTTGHPKGAMLSHKNLIRNAQQVIEALKFKEQDVFLTVIPLFHAFAATVCMNTCLYGGYASVLMENFVPAKTLEAMQAHKVTILPAVPTIFSAFLAGGAPKEAFSSVRMIVSGGAPLPASTLEALESRYGIPVLEGDGPTECSPVTSVNPLVGVRKVGSVGPPLPGVEIEIWDDDNIPVHMDEIGEIVVRGDNVMLGYLNQPEATAEAMSGGWYHTGDLGKIDFDGYVFILDRKKDMIITSGLNVYPREIEQVLLEHPGVAEVAVIGLPDALRGESVAAVVVRREDVEISERELAAYCRERIATYKSPRKIIFRDTLPKGAKGQVLKRLLKKEMELEG